MKKLIAYQRSSEWKRGYYLRFEAGLIGSLLILITLFRVEIARSERDHGFPIAAKEEVLLEEILQTRQQAELPPPPRPMVPVEVPDYEILDIEILDINAELHLDEPISAPIMPPKMAPDEEKNLEEEIFIVVEQPPELIGGIEELQSNIRYPDKAIRANVEGLVVIQFVVDPTGSVQNPVVVRGIGAGCDEEALRVIKLARFKPGRQRGIPVSVQYAVPINFRIRENI